MNQLMNAKWKNMLVILRAQQERVCENCKRNHTEHTGDHLVRELAVDFKSKKRQEKIDALLSFDPTALLNEARGIATEPADSWFSPAFMHRLTSLKYMTFSEYVNVPLILIAVYPNSSSRNPKSSECAMCAVAFTRHQGFVVSFIAG